MTVRLMNALPAAFHPTEGQELSLRGISLEDVRRVLEEAERVISYIGHEATAATLSTLLGRAVEYDSQRTSAPSPYTNDDIYIIASFAMPRRLGEGERLTEEEILAISPRWVAINL